MNLDRPGGVEKSKLDGYSLEIESLLKNGPTQAFIARRYHTTPGNLSHLMKRRGIEIGNS